MTITGFDTDNDLMVIASDLSKNPLLSQPEFFYFQHEGKVYPGLVLSTISYIDKDMLTRGTITVILTEDPADGQGWDSLANLAAGKSIASVKMYAVPGAKFMPNDCPAFIAAGLDGSAYWEPGAPTPEKTTLGNNNYWKGDHWFKPACGRIQTSIPK